MKRQPWIVLWAMLLGTQVCFAQTAPGNDQPQRDVLRQALGQQQPPPRRSFLPETTNTVRQPTLAEVEKQYLEGKITAREFQRFLQTYREPAPAPVPAKAVAASTNDVHARALAVLHKTTPNAAANPQGPAIKEPLPEPVRPAEETDPAETAKAAALQDVESKLDELIRLKQARETTNTNTTVPTTNAPAPAAPAGPQTKRQRLDDALRLYIQGKLTDAEYKDRRAKILAEPD